jgi:hypothetical protein
VLRNNGADNLSISANGPFTFATTLTSGSSYSVTVFSQPSGQTCTVSGGSGTVGNANVTSVAVSCVTNPPPRYSIGGTVSGLTGSGLVLRNNGADNLSISANGPFTFATDAHLGQQLLVTVFSQPSGQTCTVSGGSGTVGNANVTSVAVTCVTNPPPRYSIGAQSAASPARAWCCGTTARTTSPSRERPVHLRDYSDFRERLLGHRLLPAVRADVHRLRRRGHRRQRQRHQRRRLLRE